MKVAFIREMENKRIRIGIGDGDEVSRYSVSPATLAGCGLVRGSFVSPEAMELIAADDGRYRCMRKALSLLSYGDNTRQALFLKLLRSGFAREVASECVEECLRLGYINERRQIERAVLDGANRSLFGREYIVRKLAAKGYRASEVREVIDELSDGGEIDFTASFKKLCQKRGADTAEKQMALLYKYGYRSADFD